MRDFALLVAALALVAAISAGFAYLGEPQAVWLWCDVWGAEFCDGGAHVPERR